jgi:hypothetical protein
VAYYTRQLLFIIECALVVLVRFFYFYKSLIQYSLRRHLYLLRFRVID